MPVTITERSTSRRRSWGETRTVDLLYTIRGTDDEEEAGAVLASTAPDTHGGLTRLSWDIEPVSVDAETPALSVWRGAAHYGVPGQGVPEPSEVGDVRVSVSTLGATEHVTVPKERLGAYVPEGEDTTPLVQGINDDGDGHVEGVDIPARALEIEVTKVFESAEAAPDADALWAMATTVNDAPFTVTDSATGRSWTFAAGECLYLGHREGRARVDGALEITYHFAGSPNRTNVAIPNTTITVTDKPGHAYLWSLWEKEEDSTANRLYAYLRAVYVDRVFDETDFAVLGLSV